MDHDDYELNRDSTTDPEENDPFLADLDRNTSHSLLDKSYSSTTVSKVRLALTSICRRARLTHKAVSRHATRSCLRRSFVRNFILLSYAVLITIVSSIVIVTTFFPSYTHLPPHYTHLQERVRLSQLPGRGNPLSEKVFIAASIYDQGGHLTGGDWARNILNLIQLLGPDNVHLSIYENDSGVDGKRALQGLAKRVPCNHTLNYEDHLSLTEVPRVTLPDGTVRVKRMAYLSEVRNRALRPLEYSTTQFDKLLYINDVVFNPEDVLQLLFSTNVNQNGRADYRAACAVDFINPFKFYDTFATRDLEGYSMGLPFFPWFTASGDAGSLSDVLKGTDAVRVKSCWGGMVAFDAKFFQSSRPRGLTAVTAAELSPSNITGPYRFRSEEDLFWEGSECCLIHADIQNPEHGNSEIYVNPFVRVAYDSRTLSWLGLTRRFERLYTPVHYLLGIVVNLPHWNSRQYERAWETVMEKAWIPTSTSSNGGSFKMVNRIATHSGFCGRPGLSVMKQNITEGERNWEKITIPSS